MGDERLRPAAPDGEIEADAGRHAPEGARLVEPQTRARVTFRALAAQVGEPALGTGDDRVDDDPVALLDVLRARTGLGHDADDLVTEDLPGRGPEGGEAGRVLGEGNAEVTAAYPCELGRDPDPAVRVGESGDGKLAVEADHATRSPSGAASDAAGEETTGGGQRIPVQCGVGDDCTHRRRRSHAIHRAARGQWACGSPPIHTPTGGHRLLERDGDSAREHRVVQLDLDRC